MLGIVGGRPGLKINFPRFRLALPIPIGIGIEYAVNIVTCVRGEERRRSRARGARLDGRRPVMLCFVHRPTVGYGFVVAIAEPRLPFARSASPAMLGENHVALVVALVAGAVTAVGDSARAKAQARFEAGGDAARSRPRAARTAAEASRRRRRAVDPTSASVASPARTRRRVRTPAGRPADRAQVARDANARTWQRPSSTRRAAKRQWIADRPKPNATRREVHRRARRPITNAIGSAIAAKLRCTRATRRGRSSARQAAAGITKPECGAPARRPSHRICAARCGGPRATGRKSNASHVARPSIAMNARKRRPSTSAFLLPREAGGIPSPTRSRGPCARTTDTRTFGGDHRDQTHDVEHELVTPRPVGGRTAAAPKYAADRENSLALVYA